MRLGKMVIWDIMIRKDSDPQGGQREFWAAFSRFNKFTFQNFLSALAKKIEISLDTDQHGIDRAMVLNDVYDRCFDIMTYF